MTWPAPTDVQTIADELRSAVAALAQQAGSAATALASRSRLLTQVLEFHRTHGDVGCPVCGTGRLDSAWATAAEESLAAERTELTQFDAAQRRLETARSAAKHTVGGVRPLPPLDDDALPTLTAAADAHATWSAVPSGDLELADHLITKTPAITTAFTALKQQAQELVTAREDLWTPLALKLGAWVRVRVSLAWAADEAATIVTDVKAASEWLKRSAGELRNQRLAPLAERARDILARLRQESNVELGAIRLEGQATSRRLELSAEVDGVDAGALGVMSQGELHALALSLFLPRATAPDSHFRFVVLNDPIQAMDPAKVQGFVQVLFELAADRQVIVLSHDDRLSAAVRRAKANASTYEVTRIAGSKVVLSESSHPASRYLEDGIALALDKNVPDDAKDGIIPSLRRMALETAAFEVFEERQITKGGDSADVHRRWDTATTLRQRLALALSGDKSIEINTWLGSGVRREAFTVCNSGVHSGMTGHHADQVTAVRATIKELRASV